MCPPFQEHISGFTVEMTLPWLNYGVHQLRDAINKEEYSGGTKPLAIQCPPDPIKAPLTLSEKVKELETRNGWLETHNAVLQDAVRVRSVLIEGQKGANDELARKITELKVQLKASREYADSLHLDVQQKHKDNQNLKAVRGMPYSGVITVYGMSLDEIAGLKDTLDGVENDLASSEDQVKELKETVEQ